MFLLQCPKCRNTMKYQSKNMILTKKRKKCVYCNHTFKVTDSIIKQIKPKH